MTVKYTAKSNADLTDIWRWNAKKYSAEHADEYAAFLVGEIDGLATTHSQGSLVFPRSSLRYRVFLRRQGRHGHLAVYAVNGSDVEVMHVFHTAQDWQKGI